MICSGKHFMLAPYIYRECSNHAVSVEVDLTIYDAVSCSTMQL